MIIGAKIIIYNDLGAIPAVPHELIVGTLESHFAVSRSGAS